MKKKQNSNPVAIYLEPEKPEVSYHQAPRAWSAHHMDTWEQYVRADIHVEVVNGLRKARERVARLEEELARVQ